MTEPRPKDVAAFLRAARENNVEKLKEYLASGMAVDVRDADRRTPLMRAGCKGDAVAGHLHGSD